MQENCAINVENSINSGQVFLWKKNGDYWDGVNGQDILRIDKNGIIKSYQNLKTDFFRKNDKLDDIIKSISKDKTVKKAVKKYLGLRILKQDPFQCLISFIISSNSNIQKIKTSLENISKKFGTKIEFENQEFFLFPKPRELSKASINEIRSCGVGYRAKFIKDAANMIFSKEIDFESLKKSKYFETKKSICSIPGVGNKVADCVMLFSLNKLESFPLDRWMIRILEKYYLNEFHLETKTITEKQYDILHEKIVNHFGPYAGYAQQFLFKMERDNYKKKWL
ncbi:DNA repair protein [Marine Group I thaumarchaeote]|jgi:N-glycosylase/DNA lyase|uniref:DNA-(apurinic or apyrimidinic site) lyase n=1 Tax=Marine Group I thaumarchaeote TaxID=2511932 RepID=A0A7K4NHR3_9ARCH|nr:MAG: DNA repair protein [Nitrosopumilus sp. YT1]NMI82261.1 DNA repair protein [Candidatus Nitrosopumilus sp. MTA1]NWJ28348.1 DNA repair protein [Marine Group I thaumarchaeote]NWJ56292.1 DNA repair protein [Marine Group I thaumarchaeote]NWJ84121.1 DNA repair protein [Marine Group I thaumarchaeote]